MAQFYAGKLDQFYSVANKRLNLRRRRYPSVLLPGWARPQLHARQRHANQLPRSSGRERRRPNLLLVHYNDLKTDLSGEMRRVAEFLEIKTPDSLWPQLVEAASFGAMKRDGGRLMPQLERAFVDGHHNFFYKVTNSRWRDVLTDADLDLYNRKVEAELSPSLIRWLSDGRLVTGDPRTSADS